MLEPNESGYVFANTANIYFQVFGSENEYKGTILFIHGNGEDWHVFEKQIAPLSKLYRVVTVDSRGHGRSSFGMHPLTIEIMAEDVIAIMDELSIQKACIIGFSDGGNIGLQIALTHLDRVEKLIIAGANLYPTAMKMSTQLPIVLAYLFYELISLFSRKARKMASRLDLMVNQPNFDASELEEIQVPTLVLVGEKDVVKREHTDLMVDSLPNARLEVIEGANHFIFNHDHERVNAILLSFIYEKE